jgi:DNA-binding protein H-NS
VSYDTFQIDVSIINETDLKIAFKHFKHPFREHLAESAMTEFDLNNLSISDLQELAKRVDKEIEKRRSQNKKIVLDQIKGLAESIGMTVEQVIGMAKKSDKKRSAARPAMYVNPDNPTQTWSGRGRRPHWAKDALAQGKALKTVGSP